MNFLDGLNLRLATAIGDMSQYEDANAGTFKGIMLSLRDRGKSWNFADRPTRGEFDELLWSFWRDGMPHYSNKPVRYCGDTDHDQVKEFLTELPYSDLVPCRPSANVNNTAAPVGDSSSASVTHCCRHKITLYRFNQGGGWLILLQGVSRPTAIYVYHLAVKNRSLQHEKLLSCSRQIVDKQ